MCYVEIADERVITKATVYSTYEKQENQILGLLLAELMLITPVLLERCYVSPYKGNTDQYHEYGPVEVARAKDDLVDLDLELSELLNRLLVSYSEPLLVKHTLFCVFFAHDCIIDPILSFGHLSFNSVHLRLLRAHRSNFLRFGQRRPAK